MNIWKCSIKTFLLLIFYFAILKYLLKYLSKKKVFSFILSNSQFSMNRNDLHGVWWIVERIATLHDKWTIWSYFEKNCTIQWTKFFHKSHWSKKIFKLKSSFFAILHMKSRPHCNQREILTYNFSISWSLMFSHAELLWLTTFLLLFFWVLKSKSFFNRHHTFLRLDEMRREKLNLL